MAQVSMHVGPVPVLVLSMRHARKLSVLYERHGALEETGAHMQEAPSILQACT